MVFSFDCLFPLSTLRGTLAILALHNHQVLSEFLKEGSAHFQETEKIIASERFKIYIEDSARETSVWSANVVFLPRVTELVFIKF